MSDTIYALSSGALPSGVAIIRISGPAVIEQGPGFLSIFPTSRLAKLVDVIDPVSNNLLDKSLVLFFEGPNSFTGEDVLELHCHGGVATVSAILSMLEALPGFRMAEAGEFSRRGFENGKMDLTEIEGLADLIAAQTENQRKQALSQSGGQLREIYEDWRSQLLRSRAFVEAELDFADEDDVPGSVSDQVWQKTTKLSKQIKNHLDDQRSGEIVRTGFKVALMGAPNSGKSSLLNALAKRDVAIVTPIAGTTRDVLTVSLDIDGQLFTLFDTAGLRETDDSIEAEGIRRAKEAANDADLIFWLSPCDAPSDCLLDDDHVVIHSKADLVCEGTTTGLKVSIAGEPALSEVESHLKKLARNQTNHSETPFLTRQRHRQALVDTINFLDYSLSDDLSIEIRSENLRLASDCLGRITGRIDVEDLLGVIFSEFCIGK